VHDGLPDISFDAPVYCMEIPEPERPSRVSIGSDLCVIDGTDFFVRGCLEIAIKGTEDLFAWGVWVSLSQRNHERYVELFDADPPAGEGPYFGWLSNRLPGYPDTSRLKTRVYLRPLPQRPRIELEPTDHPLAVHQREGIALEDLLALIGDRLHGDPAAG
jgi:hypothetical protein